jgi:hypothetical protein
MEQFICELEHIKDLIEIIDYQLAKKDNTKAYTEIMMIARSELVNRLIDIDERISKYEKVEELV